MTHFSEVSSVIEALSCAQEVERDRRARMKEADLFASDPRNQWEPDVVSRFERFRRPRYSMDKIKPMIKAIWGEIGANDFNIRVRPNGPGSDNDTAEVYAGIIRAIENNSNSKWVYAQAGMKAIKTGYAAFRVDYEWADNSSFKKELFIRPIHDAVSRVWFLGNFQLQTCEDAQAVVIVHLADKEQLKKVFDIEEDENICDLPDSNVDEYTYYSANFGPKRKGSRIGEIFYKKFENETIYRLADGRIVSEDDFAALDEMQQLGAESRERETYTIKTRLFDGEKWLSEEIETPFQFLPVIPVLPHFEVVDDRPFSMGAVEPLMDSQRLLNYSLSKKVEETALAPKAKMLLTVEQAAGQERHLESMNWDNRPALLYNHEDGQPAPYYPAPPQHNNGLSEVIQTASAGIEESAGMFGANLSRMEGNQSGVAIQKLQHKGDLGTLEYFRSLEVAIGYCGRVLIEPIRALHQEREEVTIVKEDGTIDTVVINEIAPSPDGISPPQVINDLRKGSYSVVCDIGPAFASRKEETAASIIAMANVDPTIVQMNSDVLLNAQDTPGMKVAAERMRAQLIRNGMIPESQLTDEEREQIAMAQQQAAQQQQPDPMALAAQAEVMKAEAQAAAANAKAQEAMIKLENATQQQAFDQQERMIELQSNEAKKQLDMREQETDIVKKEVDIALSVEQLKAAQLETNQAVQQITQMMQALMQRG